MGPDFKTESSSLNLETSPGSLHLGHGRQHAAVERRAHWGASEPTFGAPTGGRGPKALAFVEWQWSGSCRT